MRQLVAVAVVLALCAMASADYVTGFEPPTYAGSPAGTIVTGQDGWYLPAGIDQNVYTYAGNTPGFAANPTGGEQFLGGISQGGTNLARAQHDFPFDGTSMWHLAYDIAALYSGTVPAAANLSSVSLQPSTTNRYFIALNNFVDPNNPPAGWKAEYNVFNAAGTAITNQSPGPGFIGMAYNHWYRQDTEWNGATNQIVAVSMKDLTTNTVVSYDVTALGWYLQGGANPVNFPVATGFRFFVGGSAGDTMGFDNASAFVPEPASLGLLALGLLVTRRR